ncbi:hypothetical protein [Nocardia sp. SSK8]|uniref:hypothetical protein n=1 Tax=Nocardia sp. SSK8 TaxID=3120154 RepID=UPI003008885A
MPDFKADINKLMQVSRVWNCASNDLSQGAKKAQEVEYSNTNINWSIFQDTWDAHLKAIQYMKSRLTEGQTETDEMAVTLNHVGKVLLEQDANFAGILLSLEM